MKRAKHVNWRDAKRRHAVRISGKALALCLRFLLRSFPTNRAAVLHRCRLQTARELNESRSPGRFSKGSTSRRDAGLRTEAGGVRHWLARRERELLLLASEWSALGAGGYGAEVRRRATHKLDLRPLELQPEASCTAACRADFKAGRLPAAVSRASADRATRSDHRCRRQASALVRYRAELPIRIGAH